MGLCYVLGSILIFKCEFKYEFLNNANIIEHHKQLVRATLSELEYDKMKEQIKVFSDPINSQAQSMRLKEM